MSKRKFVLDECIIKGALENCVSCLEAILTIVRACDTIVFDGEWFAKCYPPVARAGHSAAGLRLLRVLNQALAARDKLRQETGNIPALIDESGIHHKDVWLVRLTVAAEAALVTKDGPLLAALRDKEIACLTPEEVRPK